jgi:hypothetical protein
MALSCNPSYWGARIVGWLEVERSPQSKSTISGAALWLPTLWCSLSSVAKSTDEQRPELIVLVIFIPKSTRYPTLSSWYSFGIFFQKLTLFLKSTGYLALLTARGPTLRFSDLSLFRPRAFKSRGKSASF